MQIYQLEQEVQRLQLEKSYQEDMGESRKKTASSLTSANSKVKQLQVYTFSQISAPCSR